MLRASYKWLKVKDKLNLSQTSKKTISNIKNNDSG
ncbi:hypothetical protein BPA_0000101 (plasmid) [Borrelia parkeri SLO]|uniref:Uncharacterized protein n=1 Tax=Borrelia parkeri SLO TaxID=1313294 RepID=W5ST72_BORPR|nr:hypothetical protein BPA_0000100 [Borrelia parkeri SLO]AHH10083.1 hypothetical protein BPA_0000101 [Borrelia parkeri SLO]